MNLRRIGERLRNWRLGAGLPPEQVADRLGISRAALYKYEKEGVGRLDVLERAAGLLDVSLASLIGVDVEYYASGAAFFDRMRALEAEAEQVIAFFDPIAYTLTSEAYHGRLEIMLQETLVGDPEGLASATCAMAALARRHHRFTGQPQVLTAIVSLPNLAIMLRDGLSGRNDLPPAVLAERRDWAREEIARIAEMMETPPIGVQIGVIDAVPPGHGFSVMRGRGGNYVAVSPFRVGIEPNITLGIASVISDPATVNLYESLAFRLWERSIKAGDGARRLRSLLGFHLPNT